MPTKNAKPIKQGGTIRMVEDAGKSGEQTMDLKTWQQADQDTSKVMMCMTEGKHSQDVGHAQFSSKGFVQGVVS